MWFQRAGVRDEPTLGRTSSRHAVRSGLLALTFSGRPASLGMQSLDRQLDFQPRLTENSSVRRDRYGRALAAMFAVVLVIWGGATLYRGGLGWTNYWGGFVYAPFAIVIGLLVFVVVFKKPSRRHRTKDRSGFSWTK